MPQRLAVDGDVVDLQRAAGGLDPAQQAALEGHGVEAVEEALEGVVRRGIVGQIEETRQPVPALAAEGFDLLPGVGIGDDGAQSDDDDVEEAVALAVLAAGILEGAEVALDGEGGRGHGFGSVKGYGLIAMPILRRPP